ncbi:hypothetical protein NKH18_01395 [Streptomyces sp. M10(2022)]
MLRGHLRLLPLVTEQDRCWLSDESEDGGRYCSQHGEGWLNDGFTDDELHTLFFLRDA